MKTMKTQSNMVMENPFFSHCEELSDEAIPNRKNAMSYGRLLRFPRPEGLWNITGIPGGRSQ